MNKIILCMLLTSLLAACAPQVTPIPSTPIAEAATTTSIPATSTLVPTSLPTDTPLPTITPSPVPPYCATPLSPTDNATVPAQGPFDFTWTSFEGATSYVIGIGPRDWLPTNFPVTGTILTRYMEVFPSSSSYQWTITALNSSGQEICKAGPYTFVTSADQYATPSFAEESSALASENNDTNNNTNNGANDVLDNNDYVDILTMIQGDTDSECRLSVNYRIKSNQPFEFARLQYSYDGGSTVEFVELTATLLNPYPAYNHYSATTPPLPVKNGTDVNFGIWFKTTGGAEQYSLGLVHTMSSCSQ